MKTKGIILLLSIFTVTISANYVFIQTAFVQIIYENGTPFKQIPVSGIMELWLPSGNYILVLKIRIFGMELIIDTEQMPLREDSYVYINVHYWILPVRSAKIIIYTSNVLSGLSVVRYAYKKIKGSHDEIKNGDKEKEKPDKKLEKAFITWSLSGPETTNKNSIKFNVNLTNIGNQKSGAIQITLWSTVGTRLAKSRLRMPEISPGSSHKEEIYLSIDQSSGNGLFNIMASIEGCLSDGCTKKRGVWFRKIGYAEFATPSKEIVDHLDESCFHWGRIQNVESYLELLTHDIIVIDERLISPKVINNLEIFTEMGKEYLVSPALEVLRERLNSAHH